MTAKDDAVTTHFSSPEIQKNRFGLHQSVGFHISQTARMIERVIEEGLRPQNLTRINWCILLAVDEEGLKHPSDIAAFVGIDRTATSRALRQLEDAGLVQRSIGTQDRRMTEVQLTSAGKAQLELTVPPCAQAMAAFNTKLTQSESDALVAILHKLRDAIASDMTKAAR